MIEDAVRQASRVGIVRELLDGVAGDLQREQAYVRAPWECGLDGGQAVAGRRFGSSWAAYAFGTRIAFEAFPLTAVLVLRVGQAQLSPLAVGR
ncbi:hypothetical protein [Actinomadura sp. 9N215]|uniref:hypothetical protein n=1 Tax=Actinomadura sp. 9N215 TaxID=3375150 RepID=UPI00379B199E